MKIPKNRLDFVAKSGIAKGKRIIFPMHSYTYHLNRYGKTTRKYLNNAKFYDVDVVEAVESSLSLVYPELKYNKKGIPVETGSYHFYYPIPNPYFIDIKTGKRATQFIKVTVKKSRKNLVVIITPYKTSHINQQKFIKKKICQQITKL